MKFYGVYDLKNNEQCVGIFNIKELSKFFSCSDNSIRTTISKKHLRDSRYLILKIEEEWPLSKANKAITLIKKQRDMYFKMRNGLKETMSINNKRYKTFRRNLNEQIDILDYILLKLGGTNDEAK